MSYVSRNAATLTPCGAMPSDKGCVQEYLLSFAERAFRHPLSAEEQMAITGQFWTEMTAAGATLAEALGYGVYGVLSSPSFLYRTELGADVAADGPLTPYELATRDFPVPHRRPPDDELLAAAASNTLGHARPDPRPGDAPARDAEARANLEVALIKYFSLTKAPTRRPEPGGDAGTHRDRRHAVVDLPRGRAVHEELALVRAARATS